MVKKLFERFMMKNYKGQIKQRLELKKATIYMSSEKGYDNSFNSCIDKKYLV